MKYPVKLTAFRWNSKISTGQPELTDEIGAQTVSVIGWSCLATGIKNGNTNSVWWETLSKDIRSIFSHGQKRISREFQILKNIDSAFL